MSPPDKRSPSGHAAPLALAELAGQRGYALIERPWKTDTFGLPSVCRRWFRLPTSGGAGEYLTEHPDARLALPLRSRPSMEAEPVDGYEAAA